LEERDEVGSPSQHRSTLLLGALIAYVVVLFTGFAGPDGWAVVLFTLAAVFTLIKNRKLQTKERKNAKAHLIILAAAIVAFTPWISILVSVVFKGIKLVSV
jgi:apolipoprotein N-acyltransferase